MMSEAHPAGGLRQPALCRFGVVDSSDDLEVFHLDGHHVLVENDPAFPVACHQAMSTIDQPVSFDSFEAPRFADQ